MGVPRDSRITSLRARAFGIPTDRPEADGTLDWTQTTLILVEVVAGRTIGLGYTYADRSLTQLITKGLAPSVIGRDSLDIPAIAGSLQRRVRNLGRSGLCACAISALDTALWDLKAKLLGLPLCMLLGRDRTRIPVYGSGGFTSYPDDVLCSQLAGWVQDGGCQAVKMKIGSEPARDPARVRTAQHAIGAAALFVDANGAFDAAQALAVAHRLNQEAPVEWLEEPITSDDPKGLCDVRQRLPAGMALAAGEYIFTLDDARRLLAEQAVDVLQADVTRCGGITGFLQVSALCEAHHTDLSGHCAPALHRHVACAVPRLRHLEWFHDHVRIEHILFDGAPHLSGGMIAPDPREPGHGLQVREADAQRFLVDEGEST
jgi:L-alanine-DL-glutamate epimerase-like enolase superfamily enzyme